MMNVCDKQVLVCTDIALQHLLSPRLPTGYHESPRTSTSENVHHGINRVLFISLCDRR